MSKLLTNRTASDLRRHLYGQRDRVTRSPGASPRRETDSAEESIPKTPPPFTLRYSIAESSWVVWIPSGTVRFGGVVPTVANTAATHLAAGWYLVAASSSVYAAFTDTTPSGGSASYSLTVGAADANAVANVLLAECDTATHTVRQYQVGSLFMGAVADVRYDPVNYRLIRVAADGTETTILQFEEWDDA